MNSKTKTFSHLDEQGQADMVDISDKKATHRAATVEGFVSARDEVIEQIRLNQIVKGDVFSVARIAGIHDSRYNLPCEHEALVALNLALCSKQALLQDKMKLRSSRRLPADKTVLIVNHDY